MTLASEKSSRLTKTLDRSEKQRRLDMKAVETSLSSSSSFLVLESLEKRGFAITKIGKPVKYISVKPTEVIEKIKSNAMHDAQERIKSLSSLKETQEYTELEQLHNSGISPIKSSEIAGSLRGRSNIL